MFSSSKRLERGWRVLVRIIIFLLQPFEKKRKDVYILFRDNWMNIPNRNQIR